MKLHQQLLALAILIVISMSVFSHVSATELEEGARRVPDEEMGKFVFPENTQIQLPGFTYSTSIAIGKGKSVNGCDIGEVCAFTLIYYINAFYRYAAAAAISFAIVLIMVGGIQYTVGSAAGQIDAGRKRMWNAVIGLVLVLSTTAILSFVNPDIVTLKPLGLTAIPVNTTLSIKSRSGDNVYRTRTGDATVEVFTDKVIDTRDLLDCGESEGKALCAIDDVDIKDALIGTGGHAVVDRLAVESIHRVAASIWQERKGQKLFMMSGYRTPIGFGKTYYQECVLNGKCSGVCDPFGLTPDLSPWEVVKEDPLQYGLKEAYARMVTENGHESIDEEIRKLSPQITRFNCIENSGMAVDLVCAHEDGTQKGTRLYNGKCHRDLEIKMKEKLFCRSLYEPWRFVLEDLADLDSCMWIPGTLVVDIDQDGDSDEQDCVAARQLNHSFYDHVIRMAQYADNRDEGCVIHYGEIENSFDVKSYKFSGQSVQSDVYLP